MIRLTLSYPPQANHMFTVARGRKIKSGTYRAWLDAEAWKIHDATSSTVLGLKSETPVSGTFAVTFTVDRPDRRRRDLDNLLKPMLDCLVKGGAVADDSNAQRITIQWSDKPPAKPAFVHVTIEAIP